MDDVKADLKQRIYNPILCISISEAEAILSIVSDFTGVTLPVSRVGNCLQVRIGPSFLYLAPKPGSIFGDWSDDRCTDALVFSTTSASKLNIPDHIDLNTDITTSDLIAFIGDQLINPLHNTVEQSFVLHLGQKNAHLLPAFA